MSVRRVRADHIKSGGGKAAAGGALKDVAPTLLDVLQPIQLAILYAMLAATIGSGVQYLVKAVMLMKA